MDRFESTLKDLGKKIDGVTSDMKLQRAQMTELQTHAVDQTKLLKSLDRRTAYVSPHLCKMHLILIVGIALQP